MYSEEDDEEEDYILEITGNVAIFTHDACTLHFEEGLEDSIFRVKDAPFEYMPQDNDGYKEYAVSILKETKPAIADRKIIVIKFNELAGLFFHSVKKRMEKDDTALWFIMSFFDSDETLFRLGEGAEAALEKKVEMIDRMLLFPYIKRLETPPGGLITMEYIRQLYYENVLEERVQGLVPIP